VALAAALTVVGLTVFGTFGGLGYAAKAVSQATGINLVPAKKATRVAKPTNAVVSSPACKQYKEKVTICHKTGKKHPRFVLITVDEKALKKHKKHGDTLPAADGSCPGPPIP